MATTSGMGGMGHMGGMGSSAMSDALSAFGYHYGTGVLIALVAAYAAGALSRSRRRTVDDGRDPAQADRSPSSDSGLVDARG